MFCGLPPQPKPTQTQSPVASQVKQDDQPKSTEPAEQTLDDETADAPVSYVETNWKRAVPIWPNFC